MTKRRIVRSLLAAAGAVAGFALLGTSAQATTYDYRIAGADGVITWQGGSTLAYPEIHPLENNTWYQSNCSASDTQCLANVGVNYAGAESLGMIVNGTYIVFQATLDDVFYAGSPSAPTFQPGSFAVTGNGADTLTISAVPEPAAWALMILGFGALGGVLRAQRKSRAAATA